MTITAGTAQSNNTGISDSSHLPTIANARSLPVAPECGRNESTRAGLNPGPVRSCVVSDQDLVLDAVEEAQRVLVEYVQAGPRRSPETINMLLFLLDRADVVAAAKRLRAGFGLRVVK